MYYVVFIDEEIEQENYKNFKSKLEAKINQKKYSNIESYSNIEQSIKYCNLAFARISGKEDWRNVQ